MKIIKTGRLILYVLLNITLALSFQKTQAMEGEPKPLHRGIAVIGKVDSNSADDIDALNDLCSVVTTGKGVISDGNRVVRFKDFDYAHKTTDHEREILSKPLIDVAIRLKNAEDDPALADFFSRQTRNLEESYTAWKTTSEENQKKVFYHQLTALTVSVLAIEDFEGLVLGTEIQELFNKRKAVVAERKWFKNALDSVTGLNGEIRQVKAYVKKRPESHLVLGVRNNEKKVAKTFGPNWVFLNDEPHDPNKGRCLTVDFNDLNQLETLSSGLPGLFNSIVTDRAVIKFTEWDQRHLMCFKKMLKADGEFIFIPEPTMKPADIVVSDIDSCLTHLSKLVGKSPSTIEELLSCLLYFNRKPDFTPLTEGRPQSLSYFYQTFVGESKTLHSFIHSKKKEYKEYKDMHPSSFYTPDIIDFINKLELNLQTDKLAGWISEEFFMRYTVLWNMPILGSVFDQVLYMKDEGYCDYKPYPFAIQEPYPLYIRCIKLYNDTLIKEAI